MPMPSPVERRFFVPEVVQTSAMDCGPATLKCLLEGFGVPASYGRLREACQTDVDGTSIDTIEDVAVQLGLQAEQIMIPTDHLLLPEAQTLPAIVVTQRPDGSPHFVVAWSLLGGFVQVMDPGTGRRWPTRQRFLDETYVHFHPVPTKAWRAWAGTEGFCRPLQRRLLDLRLDEPEIEDLIDSAKEDAGWYSLATLDAATRIVGSITRAGGADRGEEAAKLVAHFYRHALQEPPGKGEIIPGPFWSVGPVPGDPDAKEMMLLRGAVLVRVRGRHDATPLVRPEAETTEGLRAGDPAPLSPDLVAALEAKPSRPELEVFRALREDGLLTPTVLAVALFLATAGVIIEALLLRGLIDIGQDLALSGQRIELMALFFAFALILLLLELPISGTVLRYGRRLETRLRIAFLTKIPRLGDRYFRSRLTSDMTQRAHALRQLRDLPDLGIRFLRTGFQLILTAAGIIWLEPASAPIAILAAVFGVGLALASQPILSERDLRLRTHLGALSRYYLDALLGLVPLRTHSAERALRREHEGLLVEWARAGQAFFRLDVVIQGFGAVVSLFFSVWIMFRYIGQGGEASGVILLLYWSLSLPVLGQALAMTGQQYPIRRNSLLRLLEPLEAPEEEAGPSPAGRGPVAPKDGARFAETGTASGTIDQDKGEKVPAQGATLTLKQASVQLGGHVVLEDLDLDIRAGEHVAVVGPSGAGKTTMVGLFLGWHQPASGQFLVDGAPLEGERLYALRRATAWVDPAVQLWNRTLLENLRYGGTSEGEPATVRMGQVVEQADLFGILERLPSGLQTTLGEGGGLVSGGEGQRVRLGRALLRSSVRLAILDEPFRGLDRARRRQLLAEARKHWQGTTLICVTHDVGETQNFERVLVIEGGRIVEDGEPDVLANRPGSRYRSLLEAEKAVRKGFWEGTTWRRLWLEDGRLSEET